VYLEKLCVTRMRKFSGLIKHKIRYELLFEKLLLCSTNHVNFILSLQTKMVHQQNAKKDMLKQFTADCYMSSKKQHCVEIQRHTSEAALQVGPPI
jgi:hypothetical protein